MTGKDKKPLNILCADVENHLEQFFNLIPEQEKPCLPIFKSFMKLGAKFLIDKNSKIEVKSENSLEEIMKLLLPFAKYAQENK